ncbi:MAG: PAS domain S-box protein [Desulfobulbus sp.]|nr:MAG: PAS domain S-box protein [Desulfobulbus sp.]
MDWLFPSVAATLAGTVVLTGTYLYLYFHDRRKYLLVWGIAWLVHAFRDLFMLLCIAPSPVFQLSPFFIANQLAALVSGLLLLWGTYIFIRRKLPSGWLIFALLNVSWIIIGSFTAVGFTVLTTPSYFFQGFVYIWTGLVIKKHFQVRGPGIHFTAGAFILWGLHKFDYPFLRPVAWFAPWGYLLSATLEIVVAIGMLLIYFEATREALAQNEERYDLAVQGSSDGIWDWEERRGDTLWCSPRIYQMLGYSPGELCSGISAWREIVHPDDRERVEQTLREHLARLEPIDLELRLRSKQMGYRWFRGRGRPTLDGPDNHRRLAGTLQDITELKNALQQLRMAFFSIEKTAMEIFWITENAHFIYVNEYACQLLGYDRNELLALTVFDIDPDFTREMWTHHWEILRSKGTVSIQSRHRRKDGSLIPVEVTANYHVYEGQVYNFAYAKDISERLLAEKEKHQLEGQIRRAQKMEAIGTLAGGIAHDFNNILGVILGYAEIARDDSPPDSPARKDLDKVIAAGFRARDLVQRILAFSRQAPVERIPLRPGPIISEALTMLRASLPSTISFQEDLAVDCGVICADPIQLHQIIMNLGTNAFHAMERSGGILRVTMKNADTLPETLLRKEGGAHKRFVMLTVQDTGCGISPEIMDKIFDPFFTTKELGKGTGMGLSMVYGIVHDYGGTILVDSLPGNGTTFYLYFPCCDEMECNSETKPGPALLPGKGHVLLVDDEQMLGEMGKTLLERLGYRVTLFSGSLDALEAFRKEPSQFDLVITDQTMPEMTGIDLARNLLQLRPDIPIILCTGYSNLVNEDTAKAAGIKAFALKPMSRDQLSQLIASATASAS